MATYEIFRYHFYTKIHISLKSHTKWLIPGLRALILKGSKCSWKGWALSFINCVIHILIYPYFSYMFYIEVAYLFLFSGKLPDNFILYGDAARKGTFVVS